MSEEKMGMYTAEEIYEELANGFLHHSMVDAMYFQIKDLQQKVEQLENTRKESIEKVKYMRKNFKQYEHIGTAYDDDLYYEDLLNILNKGSDKE